MHAHIFKLLKQKDWSIFFSITKEEYPVFDLSNFGYFFAYVWHTYKSFANIVRLFFQQNRKQTFKC